MRQKLNDTLEKKCPPSYFFRVVDTHLGRCAQQLGKTNLSIVCMCVESFVYTLRISTQIKASLINAHETGTVQNFPFSSVLHDTPDFQTFFTYVLSSTNDRKNPADWMKKTLLYIVYTFHFLGHVEIKC